MSLAYLNDMPPFHLYDHFQAFEESFPEEYHCSNLQSDNCQVMAVCDCESHYNNLCKCCILDRFSFLEAKNVICQNIAFLFTSLFLY